MALGKPTFPFRPGKEANNDQSPEKVTTPGPREAQTRIFPWGNGHHWPVRDTKPLFIRTWPSLVWPGLVARIRLRVVSGTRNYTCTRDLAWSGLVPVGIRVRIRFQVEVVVVVVGAVAVEVVAVTVEVEVEEAPRA